MTRRRIVLLVEDDAALRGLFLLALRAAGHEVRDAADGLDALRSVEALRPDVVVLDLNLPRLSGPDVLAELEAHAETRWIPVVVVTGTSLHPMNRNIQWHLRKPVTTDELLEAVDRCSHAFGSNP
jgi:CheY-like chemotaxis protein